jgi:Domain of unknown function (DUF4878)
MPRTKPSIPPSAGPADAKTPLTRLMRAAIYVGAICVIGVIIAIYFGIRSPSVPVAPARSAAQNFFNDLKTRNFHSAYGSLCGITKQTFTEDQFVSGQQDLAALNTYSIAKVTTQRVNGSPAATVVVDLTRAGGTIEHHSVPMVESGHSWHVCGEPY